MVGVVAGIGELMCFPVTSAWHYVGAFLACGNILGWMAWQAARSVAWMALQAGLLAGLARELSRGGRGEPARVGGAVLVELCGGVFVAAWVNLFIFF
jgi:hypothetical protein